MASLRDSIVEKLNELPEHKLREVLDFVESLSNGELSTNRELSRDEEDPFLLVIGTLTGGQITSREIDYELYGTPIEEKSS